MGISFGKLLWHKQSLDLTPTNTVVNVVSLITSESLCASTVTLSAGTLQGVEFAPDEAMNRYLRQEKSDEPFLTLSTGEHGESSAAKEITLSSSLKIQEEGFIVNTLVSASTQGSKCLGGEMLMRYLNQGVEDEPVRVFAKAQESLIALL